MDITDINEEDPKKLLVEIDKAIRPTLEVGEVAFGSASARSTIPSYYGKLAHAAQSLGVEFEPKPPENVSSDDWQRFFDAIVEEMDKRKIDILLENINRERGVVLDQAWRDKIHTYVEHIRQMVNGAQDLPIQIKETILHKLQAFG